MSVGFLQSVVTFPVKTFANQKKKTTTTPKTTKNLQLK